MNCTAPLPTAALPQLSMLVDDHIDVKSVESAMVALLSPQRRNTPGRLSALV
ncbi:MAG: hypothetical protein AABZ45_05240 [Pseudomonadota bacterium]